MYEPIQEIDGSVLEGGGQIIRIALTLSVIKQIPIHITSIRAGRRKPGLMEQHLKGVELLRDLSNAKVKGASLGSTEIEFFPGEVTGGSYQAFIKTAGSISLLLQVALPCIILAKTDSILRLHGGTNADMAPQIDYTTEVFRPNLEKFGASFDFDLKKRGYFPKGGGEVIINVKPVVDLKPVNLVERDEISAIYGWSFVAGSLAIGVALEMTKGATDVLKKYHEVKIETYKEDSRMARDNCAGIVLVAETSAGCVLGGSALGKRAEPPSETGKRAGRELAKSLEEGACLDDYCQDQVIVFMALATGPSTVRTGEITLHTKTAIFVVEKMTKVKFEIIPDGPTNLIRCLLR